ncbi:hypothetical protein Q4566_05350 [Tamlana sp. 2_MG-2023]|uniref:hypothetical protein n=1 Tax=unclassified Tamlana TaxID=2614803 RepID=UPI0026E277D9|nr:MULTISPECIES: hypothetical protein [unclassified Tamlana]MDO6759620.1 hypothetical protein [Tamlana sp. 2_MG-2023]MDO6792153.1 hypothetical protein [Tamlana sp. 1_MG-2023]
MDIAWIIVKFIIANILLLMISSTLIGIIFRGIFKPRTDNSTSEYVAELYEKRRKRGLTSAIVTSVITIILFFYLYKYTNIYIIIGIILNMISRTKDLLNEIRTGIKTTKRNVSNDRLDLVLSIVTFLGVAIFNYGLYLMWIK